MLAADGVLNLFCVGERSDNMVALGDEFSNVKIHRFLEGDVVFAQKDAKKKKT